MISKVGLPGTEHGYEKNGEQSWCPKPPEQGWGVRAGLASGSSSPFLGWEPQGLFSET